MFLFNMLVIGLENEMHPHTEARHNYFLVLKMCIHSMFISSTYLTARIIFHNAISFYVAS